MRAPAPASEAPAADVRVDLQAEPSRARLGRYELLFELARGGMGAVHLARAADAHGFGRLVALKTLPRGRFSETDLAAFVAEARITSNINHPNVVPSFDFGIADQHPFLAMQLVEGPALSRLLHVLADRGAQLPVEIAVWIALQIAEGLDAAHELTSPAGEPLGLVHRDVSPQNVLVSYTGRVFVADFGIAKLLEPSRLTQSGELKGKFGYMSPEQTRGELVDRRSDVFSFGVLLYEMLTGARPFLGASPAEAIYRINNTDPEPVRARRPGVPEEIEDLVRQCLARDREARVDSMRLAALALRQWLRKSGAAADESDLAELLARVLPGEREALRERVRAASTGAAPSDAAHDAPAPEPAFPSATLTASALPGVVEHRRSLRWVAALGALGLGAVLFFSLHRVDAPPNATSTPTPTSTPNATSTPTSTSTPAPNATSTPTPDDVVPPARPSGRAWGGPPAPRAGAGGQLPSATSSAQVAPRASSHKGEPFRGL